MKNIMLIAIATLTIATATASWNPWNPVTNKPLQIVNNTNVTLVVRTEPDGGYLSVPAGTTASGGSTNEWALHLAWQIGSQAARVVLTQSFDDFTQTSKQGTLSLESAVISYYITQGYDWDLVNVGYNDTLVLSGTASGNIMSLTATRQRGAGVLRGWDNDDVTADVFCLNTNVEFTLEQGATGRCPANETQIVMVNGNTFVGNNINDYTGADLIQASYNACIYDGSCHKQRGGRLDATYITGFATVPYSENSTSGNIVISLPNVN